MSPDAFGYLADEVTSQELIYPAIPGFPGLGNLGMISSTGLHSLGPMSAMAAGGNGTMVSGTANLAIAMPLIVPMPIFVTAVWHLGGNATGNTDVGLYLPGTYTKVFAGGGVANAANIVTQTINQWLDAGFYWLATSNSSATGQWYGMTMGAARVRAMGVWASASSYVLPATLTPTAYTGTDFPICGLATRSLVT